MRILSTSILFAVGCLIWQPALRAEEWRIDVSHSSVNFSVRHLGISKVRGSFTEFDGVIEAGENGRLESVTGTVDVSSIDTRNEKRDAHLRGPEFFDAEKHPEMNLVSTSIHTPNDTI